MAQITLAGTITLPPDMVWEDEFSWSKAGYTDSVGLTGKLIRFEHARLNGGRPITLKSGQESAHLTLSQLSQLQYLADNPPANGFSLNLADGRNYVVGFSADGNKGPLDATPVQPGKMPSPSDLYSVTIRLKEMPQ